MFASIAKQFQNKTLLSEEKIILSLSNRQIGGESLIMTLMMSLRQDKGTSFLQTYKQNKENPSFPKEKFFAILVELIKFSEGQQRIKREGLYQKILWKLLQIENKNLRFLSFVPKEIFLLIKNYNQTTFTKQEKKAQDRAYYSFQLKEKWSQSSKGFAQAFLALNLYFNSTSASIRETWDRLLTIVGKYNLDFNKITDMILKCCPQARNSHKIIEISSNLNKDNLKILLAHKINPGFANQENEILPCGSIQDLMLMSIQELFFFKILKINPEFIRVLKVFITENIFTVGDFEDLLPSINSMMVRKRCLLYQDLLEGKLNKLTSKSIIEPMSSEDQSEDKILYGQANFCFKVVLMYEYVQANQYQKFKSLYFQVSSEKIKLNILLFVPLLKILCELLEWIIDPFLERHSVRQYFNVLNNNFKKSNFPEGDLKQITQLNLDSMLIIEEILNTINLNVGFSMKTFIKVCRTFSIYLKFTKIKRSQFQRVVSRIKRIIQTILLAGMELQDDNFPMVLELQQLIFCFNQIERFQLYSSFMEETLFQNVYLVNQFQRNRLTEQIFNRASIQSLSKDILVMRRLMFNHPFRSCHYFTRIVMEEEMGKNISFLIQAISNTNTLLKDVMLYFTIDQLVKQEKNLMDYYDRETPKYKNAIQFLYQFYKNNPDLDTTVLFEMMLTRMNEKIVEKSAEEDEVSNYHENLIWVKILSKFLENLCPSLLDLVMRDPEEKSEFLMCGYYLKLHISGKIEQFYQNKQIRQIFYVNLCKKRANGHSYIFDFLVALNYHMKKLDQYSIVHQQNASMTLIKHGNCLDDCHIVMSHLIRLYCLEYSLKLKEINQERQNRRQQSYSSMRNGRNNLSVDVESYQKLRQIPEKDKGLSFANLNELLINSNMNLGLICIIYREYFKEDLQNNSVKEIKRRWAEIINKKKFITKIPSKSQEKSLLMSQIKINSLVKSDFFFYFWMTNSFHLVSLQKKYCSKITQMRRQMSVQTRSQNQIVSRKEKRKMEREKKNRLMGIAKITSQKDELCQCFQRFNYISFPGIVQEAKEKVNPFKIPPEFTVLIDRARNEAEKQIQEQLLKQFTSIFFNYCLLPRMLIDPSEAVFCYRHFLRTIKENKFPSNKALIMIFNMIEASIDYIQFSTEKEASRCVPMFTGNLLKLFKDWNDDKELKKVLLEEINMQKFSENRWVILKKFINECLFKINKKLIMADREPFVLKNIMSFIQKTVTIPLSYDQGQQLIKYFSVIIQKTSNTQNAEDKSINTMATKISDILSYRMKHVPSIGKSQNTGIEIENNFQERVRQGPSPIFKVKFADPVPPKVVMKKQKKTENQYVSKKIIIDLTDD